MSRTLDSLLVKIGESLRARLGGGRHGSRYSKALSLVAEPGTQILRACAENAPRNVCSVFLNFLVGPPYPGRLDYRRRIGKARPAAARPGSHYLLYVEFYAFMCEAHLISAFYQVPQCNLEIKSTVRCSVESEPLIFKIHTRLI